MEILRDGLAAIGVVSLLWLGISLFWHPKQKTFSPMVVFLPVRGAGEGLEYTLRELERWRNCVGIFGRIVIVDCGLDPTGLALAKLLSERTAGVTLHQLGSEE